MFIGSGEFFWLLRNYRVAFIGGHYGSGKTLLAVALGVHWWERGWCDHIYANIRLKGDFYEETPEEIRDAYILYDESWQSLDAREFGGKKSQRWLAYLRKRNITLVLASVLTVDVRFRVLTVQRRFALGDSLWWYAWRVNDGFKPYGGALIITHPLRYGQVYDHKEVPPEWMGERLADGLSRIREPMGEERILTEDPERGREKYFKEEGKGRGRL